MPNLQQLRLVFSRLVGSHRLIIECVECLTGYSDPADLAGSDTLRMESLDDVAHPASREQVAAAGLQHLIR